MKNFVFISPTFPTTYYQFPRAWKELGGNALCIAEDDYDSLPYEMKEAMTDYYQVSSLENYEEVFKAVAWFAHQYGKIDWLESNNEYWLEQDAQLRTDFNITTGDKIEDVMRFKKKSNMKPFYKDAKVPTARYHLTSTLEEGKKFIEEVGYPVIVKPDDGVGANATWKIKNEKELIDFYNKDLPTQYIMEEFIYGVIESYDGIVDQDNQIIFETSHIFPTSIMDIVNQKDELLYYSVKKIPSDLRKKGQAVIHSFNVRGRFFHTEYFRLLEDKEGLGKKGDLVGLEVNMRPPGGYTPDMMNFANDIDIYHIYTEMCMYNTSSYQTSRPYHCVYAGRRDHYTYKHSVEEINKKYGLNLCMQERMPDILSSAMGNEFYIARFKTEKEMNQFTSYVFQKKKESK